MRKVRNQKGFTIMELMIVIVIIGILIAIAVPAYNNFRITAINRACQANQRTLLSADGLYYAENGAHAPNIAALATYMTNAALTCPGTTPNNHPAYTIVGGVVTCTNGHTLP